MIDALYAFEMRVTQEDSTGYYYPRWDLAVPVTVVATTRAEAFQKAWAVMGACPRDGYRWTARIKKITDAALTDEGSG